MATFKVEYVKKGGAGTATTTESGKDEEEVRKKMEKCIHGCEIITIEKK